jgi:NTE family protein
MTELAHLTTAQIETVHADEHARRAIGGNPLAVSTRAPAALAGRIIGRAAAQRISGPLDT